MLLIDWSKTYAIDYSALNKRCTNRVMSYLKPVKISVIIPVRGRTEYHKIVSNMFLQAADHRPENFAVTFVEHDDGPSKHYWLADRRVNTIFIPADGKPFNKCLCHNMGVLYGPPADHYLFHDIDIIVPDDFFIRVRANIRRGYNALQAFTQRRLIMARQGITQRILSGAQQVDFQNRSNHDYDMALPGAPGGSILVEKKLLFDVGLWEDTFFKGYSIEDQFFLNKLIFAGHFGSCDNPPIELIHLWHPTDHQLTSHQDFALVDEFANLTPDEKRQYMKFRSEYFKSFYHVEN